MLTTLGVTCSSNRIRSGDFATVRTGASDCGNIWRPSVSLTVSPAMTVTAVSTGAYPNATARRRTRPGEASRKKNRPAESLRVARCGRSIETSARTGAPLAPFVTEPAIAPEGAA